jgi:hypothetical protein
MSDTRLAGRCRIRRAVADQRLRTEAEIAPNANSTGNSEPAIAFGKDGNMALDGLAWLPFQVNLWKGHFGTTPSYFGAMDTNLQNVGAGRTTLGDEDSDVEITSAGTTLLADLDLILNPNGSGAQLGVNVTRCPAGTTAPGGCTHTFIDTAGADREWITTAGTHAWLSYHDSGNSTLIRVKRSTDDGKTWTAARSPIPGQGAATGNATFNNSIGPIVADPGTGVVYESYAAGEPQTKATSANFNNVYVSRSTDGGMHWTSTLLADSSGRPDHARGLHRMHRSARHGGLAVRGRRRHLVTRGHCVGHKDHGDAVGRRAERQGRRRVLRLHRRLDR